MKKTLLWILAAVLVGIGGGAALGYWEARPWTLNLPAKVAAPKPGETRPRIEMGEAIFNFGKMESGTSQSHVFPIRNAGDAPLNLSYVSHTCKCTKVVLNDKEVEPGAEAEVLPGGEATVMLEWAAKVPPGAFRHGATFTTDDPALSRLELTIEGDIVASTTLQPAELLFGNIAVGQPATAEMLVTSAVEPQVEILAREVLDAALAERITITTEPLAKDALPNKDAVSGARIIATLNSGSVIGPFAGSLKFSTNLKNAQNLEVPILGVVRGDVSIIGKGWVDSAGLLRLEPVASAAGGATKLNVKVRGEHAGDTELRVASVNPPELKVTLGERVAIRGDLVNVPLTVEIPAGTRPMVRAGEDQGGEGEIVLATTHPNTSEVRPRVQFTVKP